MAKVVKENDFGVILNPIKDFITKNAVKDLRTSTTDSAAVKMVLKAYNRFVEDECDGTGYIFNIYDKDDLIYLVEKDILGAKYIAFIVNSPHPFTDGMFMIDRSGEGCGFLNPVPDLTKMLIDNLDRLIPFVILYAGRCDEYKEFYERYFVEHIEDYVYYNR
jgi:hypothetical protein